MSIKQTTHVYTAIEHLRLAIGDDLQKVHEIIEQFARETPLLLNKVMAELDRGNLDSVIQILHKVKSRFSYVGHDQITTKLDMLERNLRANRTFNIAEYRADLMKIQDITRLIVDEMQQIDCGKQNHASTLASPQKKVLIAEDDEVNAMVLSLFVTEFGSKAIVASDGFEAVSKTLELNPDLIFMDVHMPFSSGIEAIKSIRTKGINTTIISLSASSGLNEKDESLQAGGNDFLIKPANRQRVEQLLKQYLT